MAKNTANQPCVKVSHVIAKAFNARASVDTLCQKTSEMGLPMMGKF
jgi:hypothetical protein